MQNNPGLGVVARYIRNEWEYRITREPQHSGKFIRWDIVRSIKKLWDTCPDTMYNIKARKEGYKTEIVKVPLYHDSPRGGVTEVRAFRLGQIAYYGGRPFWATLLRSLRRALTKQYGTAMLRGHITEWIRGTWHCEDIDVIQHFHESPLTTLLSYIQGKVSK